MNNDAKLRELQRAFQIDPQNRELGSQYYSLWSRQVPEIESLTSHRGLSRWRQSIIRSFTEEQCVEGVRFHGPGLHESGQNIDIYFYKRRPDESADDDKLRELKELSNPIILSPIDCGATQDLYYTINAKRSDHRLLSELRGSDWTYKSIARSLARLVRAVIDAGEQSLCPASFIPHKNLCFNGKGQLFLIIDGLDIIQSLVSTQPSWMEEEGTQLVSPGTGWDPEFICYQNPEHIQGLDIDERSQVFQLGILLYELLSDVRPFYRERVIKICRAMILEPLKEPAELVAGIPEELNAICLKALQKNRVDRYQSLSELAAALDQATVARS